MSSEHESVALRCWGREQIERWEREERRARVCAFIAKMFWWGVLFVCGYITASIINKNQSDQSEVGFSYHSEK